MAETVGVEMEVDSMAVVAKAAAKVAVVVMVGAAEWLASLQAALADITGVEETGTEVLEEETTAEEEVEEEDKVAEV